MTTEELIREAEERCSKATPDWRVHDLSMPGEALLQMGQDRQDGVLFVSAHAKRCRAFDQVKPCLDVGERLSDASGANALGHRHGRG